MSRAITSVIKQVAKLREEEASDSSWFVLPEEGDEDVNWMSFTVEIEGPEFYTVNPVAGAQGDRPSPFKGGLFRVGIRVSDNYPAEAPEVHFQTRIWHPQVAPESGKPCVDFLKEQWKPTCGIRDVLVMLRQLLASPNQNDSVNSGAASEMHEGIAVFEKHASAETQKYAMD